MNETSKPEWPELLYPAWRETCTTHSTGRPTEERTSRAWLLLIVR